MSEKETQFMEELMDAHRAFVEIESDLAFSTEDRMWTIYEELKPIIGQARHILRMRYHEAKKGGTGRDA